MTQIVENLVGRFERWDLLEDELLVDTGDQFVVTLALGNHRMHLFEEGKTFDR